MTSSAGEFYHILAASVHRLRRKGCTSVGAPELKLFSPRMQSFGSYLFYVYVLFQILLKKPHFIKFFFVLISWEVGSYRFLISCSIHQDFAKECYGISQCYKVLNLTNSPVLWIYTNSRFWYGFSFLK